MNSLILSQALQPQVTMLTLNRPDKRNALSLDLMKELCAALSKASKDKSQRIVILRGAGNFFCAGLDLQEAMAPRKANSTARMVAKTLLAIYESPLVTIACVE